MTQYLRTKWGEISVSKQVLLKRFSRSEVKGEGHGLTNGEGIYFNGVASRLTL